MPDRPIEDSATRSDRDILYGDDSEPDVKDDSTDAKAPKARKPQPKNENQEEDGDSETDDSEDEEGTDEEDEESDEESDGIDDEDEESEDEDEDSKDEDLDKVVGAAFSGRPTYRQVINKYPKIFKDFPGLRDVFFRERDYSRVFSTVEDAQEAYDQLNKLKAGEQIISNGNPQDFLEVLGDYDKNKQRQFVESFLPSLFRNNKPAFELITQPVIQFAIRTMHRDATRNGNQNLATSAVNVYEWLFGTDKIEEDHRPQQANRPPQNDPEKENLRAENQRLLQTRHNEFIDGALNGASRRIDKIIKDSLPEELGAFEVKSITREVMDQLGVILKADSAHRSNMDRLIRNGRNEAYSEAARERLSSAFLSSAKLALPEIIKKVKAEALRGQSGKSKSAGRPSVPNRPNGSNSKMVSKVRKDKDQLIKDVKSGKISERAFLES